jgi:hypothetical protein
VVDMFAGEQGSPENLLHNPPMLWQSTAIHGHSLVATAIDKRRSLRLTGNRTILSQTTATRRIREGNQAVTADSFESGIVMCTFAANRRKPNRLTVLPVAKVLTALRAVPTTSARPGVLRYVHRPTAIGTRGRHSVSLPSLRHLSIIAVKQAVAAAYATQRAAAKGKK